MPRLIHTMLASALDIYLSQKKKISLELQRIISDSSGGELIYVVAKDDVELAKTLMFLDLITAIAKKKFGSTATVESVIPPEIRLFTIREDIRLKREKNTEKKS